MYFELDNDDKKSPKPLFSFTITKSLKFSDSKTEQCFSDLTFILKCLTKPHLI